MEEKNLTPAFWECSGTHTHTHIHTQEDVVGAAGGEGGKHGICRPEVGPGKETGILERDGATAAEVGAEKIGQEVTRAFVRCQGVQGSSLEASCSVRGHLPALSSIPDCLLLGPGSRLGSCGHHMP